MATRALRRDEGVGLALAVAAHVALVAFLVWRPLGKPVLPPPERMTVTLSEEVGLTSTSPEPAARAAPDAGPEIGEPAPPEPVVRPEPSQPIARPEPPAPQPKPQPPKPQPKPAPRAAPPKPIARPAPPPPPPAPRAAPAPRPAPKPAQARPQPRPQPAPRPAQSRPTASPPRNAGASSFADAFKSGVPGAQASGQSRNPPAQAIGPAVRSSLAGAISRQLKPKWAAPQGADAELLVTILSWNLNRDGTLAGRPTVVRQEGITDANRPQANRHAEQAIRAVQLAAPFDLREEYYDAWKRVASFRFDRKLSQ
ncbi:MAG: hypothetical protein ACTHLU_04145 [Novosphingobium sp.]